MTFILNEDIGEVLTQDDIQRMNKKWDAYRDYLQSLRGKLPQSAFEFATASWHYDHKSSRSLHDSWVNSLTIIEAAEEKTTQLRPVQIVLKLLGPYHDGITTLEYIDVISYSLNNGITLVKDTSNKKGHGDLLSDEIRLTENKQVLHEIEFDTGGRWIIVCKDIRVAWEPNS